MKILLIAYDSDSNVPYFPLGIAYIASSLRQAGHDVSVYSQDVYRYPESHLLNLLNTVRYDVVGLGACGGYYQYRKVLDISQAVAKASPRPFYVLGGHLVSPDPNYFLKKTGADCIVVGEGEQAIVDLLGITDKPATMLYETIKDVDSIPFPAWDLFPIDAYANTWTPGGLRGQRYMPVLSGRGCTFNCNFCARIDKGFRPRSPESIIAEIQKLQKDYAINYIDFTDELLMSSPKRTIELNEAFIRAGLNIHYCCNGRLNYATPEVLKAMKLGGCVFINYGIESMDDGALERMNKHLTIAQITAGVENTLAEGISPGLNIIFGNIGETKEILRKDVEFLLKYDDQAQLRTIRPVTPYPGSPLFDYAVEKGLLKDVADFYENKHKHSELLAVNFTDMTDGEFHRALFEANTALINNYYDKKCKKMIKSAEDIYLNKDIKFRGFR